MKPTTVNVITGFLGVGKTTAILNLLQQKPDDELWAILVNEFGEIGVDGGLLQGQAPSRDDVMVFEIPGGCMCCAAGLPMEMALSQLFFLASPDRIIIEPTGLGHPAEVLTVLASGAWRDRLTLRTTVALVDARHMTDDRHCKHRSFIQQLEIADVILANKIDLATPQDLQRLSIYLEELNVPITDVVHVERGALALSILNAHSAWSPTEKAHHHVDPDYILAADIPMPACGFLRADNSGEGYESVGWRFSADKTFQYAKVVRFLKALEADRIKAVLITDEGVIGFNVSGFEFTEWPIDDCLESRLEIISVASDSRWEQGLLECLVS